MDAKRVTLGIVTLLAIIAMVFWRETLIEAVRTQTLSSFQFQAHASSLTMTTPESKAKLGTNVENPLTTPGSQSSSSVTASTSETVEKPTTQPNKDEDDKDDNNLEIVQHETTTHHFEKDDKNEKGENGIIDTTNADDDYANKDYTAIDEEQPYVGEGKHSKSDEGSPMEKTLPGKSTIGPSSTASASTTESDTDSSPKFADAPSSTSTISDTGDGTTSVESSSSSAPQATTIDNAVTTSSIGKNWKNVSQSLKEHLSEISFPGKTCPYIEAPALRPKLLETDRWQTLRGNVSFVFSAYLDARVSQGRLVRVLGMLLVRLLQHERRSQMFCQLWDTAGLLTVVPGVTKVLVYKYKYESFILDCLFPKETVITSEHYISITGSPCLQPLNSMKIHDISDNKLEFKYTVCASSNLRGNYSNYKRFVEWMELNSLMGVEKTVIYKSTVDPVVEQVLEYYQANGKLEVIHWWPPNRKSRKLTHLSMINDCIYRNMGSSEYVAILDVDENIAPRRANNFTWTQMIRHARCENRSHISALNTVFHADWPDDIVYANEPFISKRLGLVTLSKTKRDPVFMPFEVHSKSILKPEQVDEIQLHQVRFLGDHDETPCVMRPQVGALHHYPEFANTNKDQGYTVDRTMHKYGVVIVQRVGKVYQELDTINKARKATNA